MVASYIVHKPFILHIPIIQLFLEIHVVSVVTICAPSCVMFHTKMHTCVITYVFSDHMVAIG